MSWLVGDAEEPTVTRVFTFSLTTQTWSEAAYPAKENNQQVVIGPWYDVANDTDVLGIVRGQIEPYSSFPGSIQVENVGEGYDVDDADQFAPILNGKWRTGKIFPFGFGGRGTVKAVRLVGECFSAVTSSIKISSDLEPGGRTKTQAFTVGRFAVQTSLDIRDIRWLQIEFTDPSTGEDFEGAGLRFNGMTLEVEGEGGLASTKPANRSS